MRAVLYRLIENRFRMENFALKNVNECSVQVHYNRSIFDQLLPTNLLPVEKKLDF